MEEEIDLRPYAEAVINHWYWIIGAGLLAAIVAFGISSLITPTYQATALVAIAEPRQRVQFDPRIETVSESQPLKAYPELAMSDEVLSNLLEQVTLDDVTNLTELQNILEAEPGSDPSLLRLSVSYNDPTAAASLANKWADLFVDWANEIYGFQGGDQLRFFEDQLSEAETELATAEQALIAFQAQNRSSTIANKLSALTRAQASYLNAQQDITFLVQDVQALRTQLERQSNSGVVSVADQITVLFLEMKAFNVETAVPLQLQFDTTQMLTQQSKQEQIQFLDNLLETLAEQLSGIDEAVATLEPQILVLQKEEQETETGNGRVTRNFKIAEDTYTILARKVEEERITSQDSSSGVRMASETAVPQFPVSPRRLLNTLTAAVLGLAIAALGVFVIAWWH